MAKYRKKPIEIEAVQVTKKFLENKSGSEQLETVDGTRFTVRYSSEGVLIETLEGTMAAEIGDWIITGVKGEMYPCKNDIFKSTYELVELWWS